MPEKSFSSVTILMCPCSVVDSDEVWERVVEDVGGKVVPVLIFVELTVVLIFPSGVVVVEILVIVVVFIAFVVVVVVDIVVVVVNLVVVPLLVVTDHIISSCNK